MSTIHNMAAALADVCVAKNAAYGDSVSKSAEMLSLLYPHGLRPDQYLDAIFAARDFDKRSRLAQLTADGQGDPHGEDPRLDIGGYALLALHENRKATTNDLCESANVPNAEKQLQGPSDSAQPSAPAPTMPSASEPNEPISLQESKPLSGTASAKPVDASAPTVTAAASAESLAIKQTTYKQFCDAAKERNKNDKCGWCNEKLGTAFASFLDIKLCPKSHCDVYFAIRINEVWV